MRKLLLCLLLLPVLSWAAAPTEVYVDPSIAGDSGSGSLGDPYGDLEYALEQVTRDATDGDRFNIKAGTDEVLEFALDIVVDYGTPTTAAPLIFQGYTATAGDGGIGGISGGGSVAVVNLSSLDFVNFIDLHLHNTGSAVIVTLDLHTNIIGCEFDNTTTHGVALKYSSTVVDNYFHNIGGHGIQLEGGLVYMNRFENETNDFATAIEAGSATIPIRIIRNIIDIDGASIGITAGRNSSVIGNSVYSAGGTGDGINFAANVTYPVVINNVVEGFSGSGGAGISKRTTSVVFFYDGNAAYDNTTEYENSFELEAITASDNETLSATPFTDAANEDFNPVDTGNIKEGSLPASFP